MLEITKEEASRCQFGILNVGSRGSNIKYLPFAFTELGVAMLSSVLRSSIAIEEVFTDYNDINDDTRMQLELKLINETLAELQSSKRAAVRSRNPIGYKTP